MKVIYKYEVGFGSSEIEMPKGADILHAEIVERSVFVWALVNPKHKMKKRSFNVFATGQELADYDKKHYHYIRTMISNAYVWHLYEVLE